MKKLLLFAMIAFTLNALAQNELNKANAFFQFPSDKMMNNNQQQAIFKKLKLFENVSAKYLKSKSDFTYPLKLTSEPLYDSIYLWIWDSESIDWKINNKNIDFVYDNNHNLLSKLEMDWTGNTWENHYRNVYT